MSHTGYIDSTRHAIKVQHPNASSSSLARSPVVHGTKRRKTMSALTSASGGESGNVANGPNSTLVTPTGHNPFLVMRCTALGGDNQPKNIP
jgi:hypothetical protein